MENQPTDRDGGGTSRKIVPTGITVVLLFFALPILCVILYGGATMAIGGLGIIGLLIAIQYPLMRLLVRRKK